MNSFERTFFGIVGVGAAVGAAWLVLELAKKYPGAAKSIVSGVNEIGNLSADKISNHPDDKLPIEIIKKSKDALAEIAKQELDVYYNQSQRRWDG